jgi:hypothetical protein
LKEKHSRFQVWDFNPVDLDIMVSNCLRLSDKRIKLQIADGGRWRTSISSIAWKTILFVATIRLGNRGNDYVGEESAAKKRPTCARGMSVGFRSKHLIGFDVVATVTGDNQVRQAGMMIDLGHNVENFGKLEDFVSGAEARAEDVERSCSRVQPTRAVFLRRAAVGASFIRRNTEFPERDDGAEGGG